MNWYMCKQTILFSLFLSLFLCIFQPTKLRAEENELWQTLKKPNHFVMIRHALAPGTGDPGNLTIGDCSTQRNLSAEGRKQAQKIGQMFRKHGISTAEIYSSQWCRCLDTAALLELGPVMELQSLNSFFRNYKDKDIQTRALTQWLAGKKLTAPHILETHQVNITAFTKVYPSSGEMVIIRKENAGEFSVLGTITTDY